VCVCVCSIRRQSAYSSSRGRKVGGRGYVRMRTHAHAQVHKCTHTHTHTHTRNHTYSHIYLHSFINIYSHTHTHTQTHTRTQEYTNTPSTLFTHTAHCSHTQHTVHTSCTLFTPIDCGLFLQKSDLQGRVHKPQIRRLACAKESRTHCRFMVVRKAVDYSNVISIYCSNSVTTMEQQCNNSLRTV
jgi:hypothetical protein